MATTLDSEAAFAARCRVFGVTDDRIASLKAKHAASFGAVAWVALYNPFGISQSPTLVSSTAHEGSSLTMA